MLIPDDQREIAARAVGRAHAAFRAMATVADEGITRFFQAFAARLEAAEAWEAIAAANRDDVARARELGRSTTRLEVSDRMRVDMVQGLRAWGAMEPRRGRVLETIHHEGGTVELVAAPLGVVGFVFEGRPNVFADATGVLRNGNTAVLRIGGAALGTARAIVRHALDPALEAAGLPDGAVALVESTDQAAGLALFADPRLALAVARGSGPAVEHLGKVARQAGIAVSLHGTGGAWIVADRTADKTAFGAAVYHSLDRKVCNSLNVGCIVRDRAADLVPAFLGWLQSAGQRRGGGCTLHVLAGDDVRVPDWFAGQVVELPAVADLGQEWEWDDTPEVSLKLVADVAEAVDLFNRYSPQFVASLISADPESHRRFYETVNAPFVGTGFTRWVDGQYALRRPELGLSNWQHGRLLARSGILSGDGVYTVRVRFTQSDPDLHR